MLTGLGETKLKEVADRLGKTEAQVAIRWSIQMGYITIPKSVNEGRIKQNGEAAGDWDIPAADMDTIAAQARCACTATI